MPPASLHPFAFCICGASSPAPSPTPLDSAPPPLQTLNKRLDIVNDLLDSISSQLEVRTAHRLEVIIIALIMIEIGLELFKGVPLGRLMRWPVRAVSALVFKATA